ncbi:MAG: hypothetical protein IJR43_09495, partial [Synergistaceae bacterium]|nr:hypothetical protein [Synergistaceae bacterium]
FDMASIGASIGFAYTSVSAAKYAWYERRLDILIFGLLGFILSLGMAFLLLVPIDGLHVSLSNESYILLVIWSVLGIVFYRYGGGGIRRVIHSRKKKLIRE